MTSGRYEYGSVREKGFIMTRLNLCVCTYSSVIYARCWFMIFRNNFSASVNTKQRTLLLSETRVHWKCENNMLHSSKIFSQPVNTQSRVSDHCSVFKHITFVFTGMPSSVTQLDLFVFNNILFHLCFVNIHWCWHRVLYQHHILEF